MKEVRITSPGHPELEVTCKLVSNYADLVDRDMVKLVRNAYQSPNNMAAKLELIRDLFEAPPEIWKQLEAEENREELWRLIQTLEWVWRGPETRPLPWIRIRNTTYVLPDEELTYLTTAEFVIATAHLMNFHSAKDDVSAIKSLTQFMATIARPRPEILSRLRLSNPNGDPREAYNSVKATRRAPNFEAYDLWKLILIAQWFNNAANALLKKFGMREGDPEAAPISVGLFVQDWERQVVKAAESQVFGNYDQVMSRPIADVLAYIDLKNDEMKRQNSKK